MRVFISWSGPITKNIAKELKGWLEIHLQYVKAWLSTDIPKGTGWLKELQQGLTDSDFGIICVTSESLRAPWLSFEAGALAATHEYGRVAPLLLGVTHGEVGSPLGIFQGTLFDKEDVHQLINRMNTETATPLDVRTLDKVFESAWPKLQAAIKPLLEALPPLELSPRRAQSQPANVSTLDDLALSVLEYMGKTGSDAFQAAVLADVLKTPPGRILHALDVLEEAKHVVRSLPVIGVRGVRGRHTTFGVTAAGRALLAKLGRL